MCSFDMQSRAKIPHVAVLIGICKIQLTVCFLEDFFNPRNQIRNKLDSQRQQIGHVISSFDCNRSPDAWPSGLWDSLRPDDDEPFYGSLSGIQ